MELIEICMVWELSGVQMDVLLYDIRIYFYFLVYVW